MIRQREQILSFIKQTRGSITLESALVLPLFFLLLFTIILIGIALLNVNTTHFIQLTAVERAAFNWDKHDRQFASGIRQSDKRYGTYEHDLILDLLSRLFHIDSSRPLTIVTLSDKQGYITGGALREDKLKQANDYLLSGSISLTGELQYTHRGFIPRVSLISERQNMPLNLSFASHTSAIIVNGPQHIRGVDLLIYYGKKLNNMRNETESWLTRAKEAIPSS